MKNKVISKICLWVQALFYLGSGINHFVNPAFYLDLIPAWLPFKPGINALAGIGEILLGIGLILLPKYRQQISILIIILLLGLLPAHIYHLTIGGCLPNGFCIPIWACWVRIFLQFLLIYWAWSIRKVK